MSNWQAIQLYKQTNAAKPTTIDISNHRGDNIWATGIPQFGPVMCALTGLKATTPSVRLAYYLADR